MDLDVLPAGWVDRQVEDHLRVGIEIGQAIEVLLLVVIQWGVVTRGEELIFCLAVFEQTVDIHGQQNISEPATIPRLVVMGRMPHGLPPRFEGF